VTPQDVLELRLTVGFVNEAILRLSRLLGEPAVDTEAWQAEYREALQYFEQVRDYYVEHSTALLLSVTRSMSALAAAPKPRSPAAPPR
jgi:hypothetical protein